MMEACGGPLWREDSWSPRRCGFQRTSSCAPRRAARSRGISPEQLICESLKATLARRAEHDPLYPDQAVFGGPGPSDFAAEHDRCLYRGSFTRDGFGSRRILT
jgi:hypothetical protein